MRSTRHAGSKKKGDINSSFRVSGSEIESVSPMPKVAVEHDHPILSIGNRSVPVVVGSNHILHTISKT